MRAGIVLLVVVLLVGVGVGTWFLAKSQCGYCPPPIHCPDCPDCPSSDPCPKCPDCPTPDPCPKCPDCPSCPATDCTKDCPYTVPDSLLIDMTASPPSAVFLGIGMEYTGTDPDQASGRSAIFSYKGLPDIEVFVTEGGLSIIQVNGYYDPTKPNVFAQITAQGPGVYSDNKVLPVSVKI